jgi:hypothetical protein
MKTKKYHTESDSDYQGDPYSAMRVRLVDEDGATVYEGRGVCWAEADKRMKSQVLSDCTSRLRGAMEGRR